MKDIDMTLNKTKTKIGSIKASPKGGEGGQQIQLNAWQLWRSLPRPCKIFLLVCIIQAFVSGAFASRELARPGLSGLQDLLLILVSSIYFLLLVFDAFWHENGYQLLISMASGALNLVQLIVYATALSTGTDGTSVTVVVICAVLQAITVGLARWAYLGFGWRMYSKIACDATLPDAERRRAIGLRLGRFSAVAKLNIQILCLLLIVGVVNGTNPGGSSMLTSLIVVACVGIPGAAAWLAVCWTAVASARPQLGLAAEFTYPICYIVAAAFMFSSVVYSSDLAQVHGTVYLFVYPVLFVASHTWVWWDARLLSVSDIARQQRDFAAQRRQIQANKNNDQGGGNAHADHHTENANTNNTLILNGTSHRVPPEILPLVHGAWLLKLPSAGGIESSSSGYNGSGNIAALESPARRTLREFLAIAKGTTKGRWRYFQLSHDGSTLRWDWRKFVLLVHVESVSCNPDDLTITLGLTLEPDLRLKFPDAELHAAWARGLTLLVMLLGNPDGLEGNRQGRIANPVPTSLTELNKRRSSLSSRDSGLPWFSSGSMHAGEDRDGHQPSSPNRLSYRLASASGRASAAGLLTKEALEYAAWKARRAFGDASQPPSPDIKDLEQGGDGVNQDASRRDDAAKKGPSQNPAVISLYATAATTPKRRTSSSRNGGILRQRTPRSNDTPPPQYTTVTIATAEPSPSPSKSRARPQSNTSSWLRRTFTAPVNALAAGIQQTAEGAARQWIVTSNNEATQSPSSPFDIEANNKTNDRNETPNNKSSGGYSTPIDRVLFNSPPRQGSGRHPRHLRSISLDNGQVMMPSVPEGSGSFTPVAYLPALLQSNASPASVGSGGGGTIHLATHAQSRLGGPHRPQSNLSPGSNNGSGGNNKSKSRSRRQASPLKPAAIGAIAGPAHTVNHGHGVAAPLIRYSSAPMYTLQHALSGIEPADSSDSVGGQQGLVQLPAGTAAAVVAAAALQRMGSDASWHQMQSSGGSGALARYDSLGPQIAPGSKLWQTMFDAGMATYQISNATTIGSLDGSPTPTATPLSLTRSVAINMELIDFEQLSFGRMLGEGAEGPVYAAWFQETPVAVKRASSQAEVDLHLHAGWHDNVVNLRGLAQHGGHMYLVMELCPRGTLDVLIHQGSSASPLRMDPAKLLPIVRSIARGMLHLHTRSPPVLHRDLKPANVFIGHGYVMKIGDFGMARYGADTRAHRAAQAHLDPGKYGTGVAPLLRTLTPGVIGTAAYCAPELLHPETPKKIEEFNEERLLKADVYSFGVLLWELLERKRPYAGWDGFQIQTQWVLDPSAMKLKAPKVPDTCKTPEARRIVQMLSDLVEACTAWDPDERPNFKEILAILRGGGQDDAPPTPATQLVSPF